MKAVRQISTGRLVWREIPDFEDGQGIINAAIDGYDNPSDLEEVEITEADWAVETALREAESPLSLNELMDTRRDNPQRNAFKASALYGLTHEQLDTYIDDNVTNLATAREFVRKLAHVILWLVKQTKMDE